MQSLYLLVHQPVTGGNVINSPVNLAVIKSAGLCPCLCLDLPVDPYLFFGWVSAGTSLGTGLGFSLNNPAWITIPRTNRTKKMTNPSV